MLPLTLREPCFFPQVGTLSVVAKLGSPAIDLSSPTHPIKGGAEVGVAGACFSKSATSESDPSHANQLGEIRRLVRRPGRGIDVLSLLQFWKWESVRDQTPSVVQQLIQRAVQQ